MIGEITSVAKNFICFPKNYDTDINGKTVEIKAEVLLGVGGERWQNTSGRNEA